jgi:hypothetical protein
VAFVAAVGGYELLMRKFMAALLAGSMLLVGVACDDNNDGNKSDKGIIDQDDTKVGPGDGKDETGPGR